MKNKLDVNKIIKELSRDEFSRKATKVFPSKKRENNRKNTREILRDSCQPGEFWCLSKTFLKTSRRRTEFNFS